MGVSFPGESAQYRQARDRLLEQEAELRHATEAVAAARRALPPGGTVPDDCVFQGRGPDGRPVDVSLPELFGPGQDTLVMYNMMFPRARQRDWRHLRLLSSAGSTYNRDYLGEAADGSQMPMLNVFRRDSGTIRHFWGSELLYAPSEPGQDPRHTDSIDALWNLFDLVPEGRGTDWYPELSYG
jgi:predicted dithiol-disulfide oxidoreductase (DUF899 family)